MQVRKIRNVQRIEDDAYSCTVEFFIEQEQVWKRMPYVARKDDSSPVNEWIINQISTGKYKITDQRV